MASNGDRFEGACNKNRPKIDQCARSCSGGRRFLFGESESSVLGSGVEHVRQ
jgi:hypothetical protein